LVAVAIAIARRDVVAPAGVNRARAVADSASVVFPDTHVFVITDPVPVDIRHTVPSAFANRIFDVAVAITITQIFRIRAGPVVLQSSSVKIARIRVCAPWAIEDARTVILLRRRVVVARSGNGTPHKLVGVANAVLILIRGT
jgi:hypothetical protein